MPSKSTSNSLAFRLLSILVALPRGTKRLVIITVDVVMLAVALWSATALKQETLRPTLTEPLLGIFASLVLSVFLFARLGLYRAVTRFIAPRAVAAVALGVAGAVAVLALVDRLSGRPDLSVSVLIIFWALAFLYVGATRFFARIVFLRTGGRRESATRVLIYGAGEAGVHLSMALSRSAEFLPLAFIDDNESLHGSIINGLQVFGTANLASLVEDYGVSRILLALPSITRARRKEILSRLEPLSVRIQTIPDYALMLKGAGGVDQIRDLDPSDLLGRNPVAPDMQLLGACIRKKCVLVTGAGGSIGSELCRQIIREEPARLLLMEMSEHSLYQLERELRAVAALAGIKTEIVALLGNAHHKYRVREILNTYSVQSIYHAAAYKHVPIVEQNMVEGVHNNIISTWHTAEAAVECGVEVFVLVSTDKAVNPTNVMGATKRFAEIVLQGLHQRGSSTRFCMVRFGNVLESSGSVVPLFREQIRSGGPVTVTHPDVIRYFMTIPEAAQLVLQASAMARGGDVFVLDMGKPIKIDDLARRMIQLSGYTVRDAANPDGDIEIAYTGLRPAEKLYEELLIGNTVTGTQHPMILRAVEHALPWVEVSVLLDRLGIALRRFDCRTVLEVLTAAVREYHPTDGIQDVVWLKRPDRVVPESRIADLTERRARQPSALPPN